MSLTFVEHLPHVRWEVRQFHVFYHLSSTSLVSVLAQFLQMRWLGPSKGKSIVQWQAGIGAKLCFCDLANGKKNPVFYSAKIPSQMIRPWASKRKTLWLVHLWTPSTWHILRTQHMLVDRIVIRFSGWEQTSEDMESTPYLTCLPKGRPHCTRWDICAALSIGQAPSGPCSFLLKLFLFLEGWFPAPVLFWLGK